MTIMESISQTDRQHTVMKTVWAVLQEKYRFLTEVYGFDPWSWEVRAIPQSEAFWSFETPEGLMSWLVRNEVGR
jgi:hypothetical protein